MEINFEEIKDKKIIEVTEFFNKFDIQSNKGNEDYIHNDIVELSKNNTNKKEETKFYWTRLSINSNAGYKID